MSVHHLPRLTLPHRQRLSPTEMQDVPLLVQHGLNLHAVDLDLLGTLQPDVIVTQLPPGIPLAEVVAGTCHLLGKHVEVIPLQPLFLQDIWDDIYRLGEVTGHTRQVRPLLDALFERVNAMIAETMMIRQPPRVTVLTGLEPLTVAGYWVPDMIQIAGGSTSFVASGQPDAVIEWATLQTYQPEVLMVMQSGLSLAEVQATLGILRRLPGWEDVPAVQHGQVYFLDAQSYCHRPGPRIVDALDLLAALIHPDIFGDNLPPAGQVHLPGAAT